MPAPPPVTSQLPVEADPADPADPGEPMSWVLQPLGRRRGSVDVAVENAPAVGADVHPAVDARIALNDGDRAVLMSQIGDGDPGGTLVIGTEEAVEAIDGAGDEDGRIALPGSGHADADLIGGR